MKLKALLLAVTILAVVPARAAVTATPKEDYLGEIEECSDHWQRTRFFDAAKLTVVPTQVKCWIRRDATQELLYTCTPFVPTVDAQGNFRVPMPAKTARKIKEEDAQRQSLTTFATFADGTQRVLTRYYDVKDAPGLSCNENGEPVPDP
jgi:hypothetical protein